MSFLDWHHRRIVRTAARLLVESAPSIRRVLDLGCGDGERIREILSAAGAGEADVFGLDLQAKNVGAARARGIRAEEGDLRSARDRFPAHFDLVHSYGASEFLPDFSALAEPALEILRPGGRALLQIGFSDSMARSWFEAAARTSAIPMHAAFARPEEVPAALARISTPHRARAMRPIWHYFPTNGEETTGAAELSWRWEARDLVAHLKNPAPCGSYLLLERI